MSHKPRIGVAFKYFWRGFRPETFAAFFPQMFEDFDLYLSPKPQVVFHSVFSQFIPFEDQSNPSPVAEVPRGDYIRVLLTGENVEPDMTRCDFAISFSRRVQHPNHLRLPLWVYENRAFGFPPQALLRTPDTDWGAIAAAKTRFCNFIYSHGVPFRDQVFDALSNYRRIDSAGHFRNTMGGWTVPMEPNRLAGKVAFMRECKFTLAIENAVWPGYASEKLADPFFAHSVPIYVGDPLARTDFNPEAFIDGAGKSVAEIVEMVREIDNDKARYLALLAAPPFAGNVLPRYAQDETIRSFFERIFAAAPQRG